MEPEWTKKIDSKTIVTYYYNIFFIFVVIYGTLILTTTYGIYLNPKIGYAPLINMIFAFVFGAINMLFMYIVSSRALLK